MFEHEDLETVRQWLRDLGFTLTDRNGWEDDRGYIASITWSATKGKWFGSHTRPVED